MKNRPKTWHYVLYIAATLALASVSKADTIILTDKPSNSITAAEAMRSKKPVYKCQKKVPGPSINPVNAKGSTAIWSTAPGKSIDNAGEIMASGKFIYLCRSMLLDNSTARMRAADAE